MPDESVSKFDRQIMLEYSPQRFAQPYERCRYERDGGRRRSLKSEDGQERVKNHENKAL